MSPRRLASGPAPIGTAQAAIALYPISARCRVELVRYGENTTYHVSDGERSFALRLARPGYQSRVAVESEIAWMAALRGQGIDTPQAINGSDGGVVQQLRRPDGTMQLAVAFEWVDGVPLPDVKGPQPWRRLGEIMGRVHEHARVWSPPRGFTRPAWDLEALVGDSPRWGTPAPRGVWSQSELRAILAARAACRERLAQFGTCASRFGMIHSDLGFENVLVQRSGHTVVIDFDDSGPSWYLYELASALYPLEGTSGFQRRRDMLIGGYRAIRPLPDDDIAELPTFLMCRRLATLGWTFSRADTAHARRQRERRLATTPAAARRFLKWHGAR
jgi:Ser/Thr protein kinase RdoA (MazF antagonist)